MIILISKIVLVLSILGIVFIVFRKIPALLQLPEGPFVKKLSFKNIFKLFKSVLNEFISSDFFQNIIIGGLEKSLRKFKVVALKIDNIVDKFLRKLKKNSKE